ncbi:MAG: hypothetical protein PVH37_29085 [Desulfobacterales bacterium]|jgi:hypothetical protein
MLQKAVLVVHIFFKSGAVAKPKHVLSRDNRRENDLLSHHYEFDRFCGIAFEPQIGTCIQHDLHAHISSLICSKELMKSKIQRHPPHSNRLQAFLKMPPEDFCFLFFAGELINYIQNYSIEGSPGSFCHPSNRSLHFWIHPAQSDLPHESLPDLL